MLLIITIFSYLSILFPRDKVLIIKEVIEVISVLQTEEKPYFANSRDDWLYKVTIERLNDIKQK